MLFVLAVFQEGDRFVGRHHITELLDHILQRGAMFIV